MKDNYITVKCPIEFKDTEMVKWFIVLQKHYNSLRNYLYNRLCDEYIKSKEILSKSKLYKLCKNIKHNALDTRFWDSAIVDALCVFQRTVNNYNENLKKFKKTHKKDTKNTVPIPKFKPMCFGGKDLYKKYQKGDITHEELLLQKMSPIYVEGDYANRGNSKFRLINTELCAFKPFYQLQMDVKIVIPKSYIEDFKKLIYLQSLPLKSKECIPIHFKMNSEFLYVTYDLNKIREIPEYHPIENRIFSFDNNPEHIGCTVVDWNGELDYKMVSAFDISIEDINKYDNSLKGKGLSTASKERKYVSNKRNFEIEQIAKFLVNKAKHYRCEIFGVEELNFEKEDLGSHYSNKLCRNQWLYRKLLTLIEKHCKLNGIKFHKAPANYSSFIGNLFFQKENLPDYCLASLEISRRSNEYIQQYIKKSKSQEKTIIFPKLDLVRRRISDALEVIGYNDDWTTLRDLYLKIKKSELKYRFPLSSTEYEVFRLFSRKSCINLYNFR